MLVVLSCKKDIHKRWQESVSAGEQKRLGIGGMNQHQLNMQLFMCEIKLFYFIFILCDCLSLLLGVPGLADVINYFLAFSTYWSQVLVSKVKKRENIYIYMYVCMLYTTED